MELLEVLLAAFLAPAAVLLGIIAIPFLFVIAIVIAIIPVLVVAAAAKAVKFAMEAFN